MSDTPWTPGPWEVTGRFVNGRDPLTEGPISVCQLDTDPHAHPEADARLIAAAPEMAELLRRVTYALNTDGLSADYESIDDIGDESFLLLARIRGEK